MRKHLILKFLALFICAASLLISIAGGICMTIIANHGLYEDTVTNLQDQQLRTHLKSLAEDLSVWYAAENLSNCPQSLIQDYVDDYYLHDLLVPGQWRYTLEDMNGQLLDSSTAQPTGRTATYEFVITPEYPIVINTLDYEDSLFPPGDFLSGILDSTQPSEEDADPEDSDEFEPADSSPDIQPEFLYSQGHQWTDENGKHSVTLGIYRGPTYLVTLHLLEGAYQHPDSWEWRLLEMGFENRYTAIVALCMGLLCFSVSCVYLCTSAGKADRSSPVEPTALNKLPLDLYAGIAATVIYMMIAYILNIAVWISNPSLLVPGIVGISVCGFAGCLIFVGFIFAIAAQSKLSNGYWWQHSALRWGFRKLRILFRYCGIRLNRLLQLMPLVWQWILFGAIFGICTALILITDSLLLLIVTLVLFALCIVYIVYAMGLLLKNAKRMGNGDLSVGVQNTGLVGCFRDFADDLNALADVAVVAARQQTRSERMKTELITNVSHDIKTPLTSIINYVDLLQKATTPEEKQACLEVLERQSMRMKKLIEDLVEMSKASSGSISAAPVSSDASETVSQALGEFSGKLDAVPLTPIVNQPETPVYIYADGRLTWRVLSNLLSNAVKYALPGTRLYVDITELESNVLISLKNVSREPLNISSEDLMERFVRGDASRNTEGSGLGLNIAKSLMEIQKGQLQLLVDGDLFKATLVFPKPPAENS